MNAIRARAISAVAVLGGAAALVATAPAQSAQEALTSSNIATPKNLTYLVDNTDNPATFTVSGTSNGTTGDHVDILCYAGGGDVVVDTNVAVTASGSFSTQAGIPSPGSPCKLAAVPSGTSPNPPTGFTGPTVLGDVTHTIRVNGGPNDGKAYDFSSSFQQLHGGSQYGSITFGGLAEAYLNDSSYDQTTITWYGNATLREFEESPTTRSGLLVDGVDAWPTAAAVNINSAAPGLQKLTYTYKVDPKTGDARITDTEPLVECSNHTYPPTAATCPSFHLAGVTDYRTILQTDKGSVAWITDVFKSTDGKRHTLDLLYTNTQVLVPLFGDVAHIEFKFPGQSGYSEHSDGDTVTLPATSGTMLIRKHGAADGDTATGQGAMVYDRPASDARFEAFETFTLHQKGTIPAGGSTRFRFAYVQDYWAANVASLAKMATTVFKGCTVPNVVGKTLGAAKKAIRKAHCAVGKVTHATSATVATGHVISSKPKAKTRLDYDAEVALVVSTGT